MPLIVEDNLPARKILETEKVFTIGKARAKSQDIRPINIAIVNLMPNKLETEVQLLRALSNTPLQINIDLIGLESYRAKNTDEKYLEDFYKNFSDIKDKKYDGMIITGAPVEKLSFEEVLYWQELKEIFEYARENVFSTMFICWASQAALYYYYNIPKYRVEKKIFGVYEYDLRNNSPLVKGYDDLFYSPQSRYSLIKEEDLKDHEDLIIVASREDIGPGIVTSRDNRFIFISGHSEYDDDSLYKEYTRDLAKGVEVTKPNNYFKNDDQSQGIRVRWRAHGNLLFSNWINHCVYQETPYDMGKIRQKKVAKFGGSSLSDSGQFIKVRDIIKSESSRSLLVVSAPGKRFSGDLKITDLLIGYCKCEDLAEKDKLLEVVRLRFYKILRDLNLGGHIISQIDEEILKVKKTEDYEFIVSRGEYISGLIMASFLGFKFIDAKDLISFNELGFINKDETYRDIKEKIGQEDRIVLPGFYGRDHEGNIKTFERGGSDITGSIIASALKADVYENWTDVDGLMDKDPRKYEDAKLIDNLSYEDFIAISLREDQVYHIDAIRPVMEEDIPINIRNTNNPNKIGTIIRR